MRPVLFVVRAMVGITALYASALVRPTPGAAQSSATDYRVVRRFVLGGEGGWDYLVADPASGRLFVTRGSHVMVVDPVSGRIVGDIPGTSGVHGIALVSTRDHGFTSNGRDSSVTMFQLGSLAVLRRIAIPARNPDAIMYDSASDRVFTFNSGSASATALDPDSGGVLGSVSLDGNPEVGVADGLGHIYVNIEDRAELTEFDARTLQVVRSWPLAPCESPTGLAMDRRTRRLFVGCGNRLLAVVDAGTGRVVVTLPIGGRVDGVVFEPSTQLIFASAGEGLLTIAQEASANAVRVVANVPTQRGARTMALDPSRQEIYLVTAEFQPAPTPAPGEPSRRPTPVPGSFTLLVVSP